MVAAMVSSGTATDLRPTERPAIMMVATPVSPWRAISRIGPPAVKCSVMRPITIPPTAPHRTQSPMLELRPRIFASPKEAAM